MIDGTGCLVSRVPGHAGQRRRPYIKASILGIWKTKGQEDQHYGKFATVKDPESNKVELWEAPDD